ncbi:MAG: hypothetical protein ACI4HZ_10355 [Ruminococcus sp.]
MIQISIFYRFWREITREGNTKFNTPQKGLQNNELYSAPGWDGTTVIMWQSSPRNFPRMHLGKCMTITPNCTKDEEQDAEVTTSAFS